MLQGCRQVGAVPVRTQLVVPYYWYCGSSGLLEWTTASWQGPLGCGGDDVG
jgi:hypothetical protein